MSNNGSMMPPSQPPIQKYDPMEQASVLNNIGALYHERDEYASALRLYQESLHVRMEMLHSRPSPPTNNGIDGQDGRVITFNAMVRQEETMSHEWQIAAEQNQMTQPKYSDTSLILFPFLTTARERGSSVVTGLSSASVDEFVFPAYSRPLHLPHSKNKIEPMSSPVNTNIQQERELSSAISLYNMGLAHHKNGTLEKATELFRMALSVLSRKDHANLVSLILLNIAQVNCRQNEIDVALGNLAEAYGVVQDALGNQRPQTQASCTEESNELPDPPQGTVDLNECFVLTLSLIGQVYYFKGDGVNAFDAVSRLLEWHNCNSKPSASSDCEKIQDQLFMNEAVCRYNLGLVHRLRGEVEDAIRHIDYFVSVATKFYGIDLSGLSQETSVPRELSAVAPDTTSQVAAALQILGSLYVEDASVFSALHYLKLSLALHRMDQDFSMSTEADILFRIGQILHHTGQNSAAMSYHRQSLHILQKQRTDPNYEDMAMIMSNIGQMHHSQGELDESISVYEEVLRISRLVFSNEDGRILDLLCIIGNLYLEKGDNAKAHALFVEAATIMTQMQQLQVQQTSPHINSDGGAQDTTDGNQVISSQSSAPDVLVIIPSLTHGFGIEWYPCAAAA